MIVLNLCLSVLSSDVRKFCLSRRCLITISHLNFILKEGNGYQTERWCRFSVSEDFSPGTPAKKFSDFQIRFLVMWRDFILFVNLEIMDLWTHLQVDAILNQINIQLKQNH